MEYIYDIYIMDIYIYIYIYIYIVLNKVYIYCHPQTDNFVVSQLSSVA